MPASFGEKTAVAYEQVFYSGTQPNPDGTPSDAGIANAAQNIAKQAGAPHFATSSLSIMDIEHWLVWPFVKGNQHLQSIQKYADTMDRFGDAIGQDVCLYAVAPQAGINHANFSLSDPAVRDQWTYHSNITRDILIPKTDALCPSIYVYYGDNGNGQQIERWRQFAIETIKEARRIAPDQPVYPFVWPQFHGGGGVQGYPFIPKAYWRVVLETMREHADGVVLWGGYDFERGGQLEWNESADWVTVTREVLGL